jgi:hypothetical protein
MVSFFQQLVAKEQAKLDKKNYIRDKAEYDAKTKRLHAKNKIAMANAKSKAQINAIATAKAKATIKANKAKKGYIPPISSVGLRNKLDGTTRKKPDKVIYGRSLNRNRAKPKTKPLNPTPLSRPDAIHRKYASMLK